MDVVEVAVAKDPAIKREVAIGRNFIVEEGL